MMNNVNKPLAVVLTLGALGLLYLPTLHADEQRERVGDLVGRLSDPSFQEREKAQRALWSLGPETSSLLKPYLATSNLETRRRLQEVLLNWNRGVTADLPRETQDIIHGLYQTPKRPDTDPRLLRLIREGRYLPLVRYFQTTGDVNAFTCAMQPSPSKKPAGREDFQIEMLGVLVREHSEQLRTWPHLLDGILLAPQSTEFILSCLEVLQDLPARSRTRLLDRIRFNASIKTAFENQDVLKAWIELCAVSESLELRRRSMAKLFFVHPAGSLSDALFDRVLPQSFETLSPQAQFTAIEFRLASTSSTRPLESFLEASALLELCDQAPAPDDGHRLLGNLLACSTPTLERSLPSLTEALEDRTEPNEKEQLLVGFVESLTQFRRPRATSRAEKEQAVWSILTTGDASAWKLPPLLLAYERGRGFADQLDRSSMEFLVDAIPEADFTFQNRLLRAINAPGPFATELQKHDLQLRFLQHLFASERDVSIPRLAAGLLKNRRFTQTFSTAERRRSLLDFCLDPKRVSGLYQMASNLVVNPSLLAELLNDGHYETIRHRLIRGKDGLRKDGQEYGILLGRFFASPATVSFLNGESRAKELVSLLDTPLSQDVHDGLLKSLVERDDAMRLLLQQGYWETLVSRIDSVADSKVRDALWSELYGSKTYVDYLITNQRVIAALKRLDPDESRDQLRFMRRFIFLISPSVIDLEPEAGRVCWQIGVSLDEHDVRPFLSHLFAQSWFLECLASDERLQDEMTRYTRLPEGKWIQSELPIMLSSMSLAQCCGRQRSDVIATLLALDQKNRSNELLRRFGTNRHLAMFVTTEEAALGTLETLRSMGKDALLEGGYAFVSNDLFSKIDSKPDTVERLAALLSHADEAAANQVSLGLLATPTWGRSFGQLSRDCCLQGDLVPAIQYAFEHCPRQRIHAFWPPMVQNITFLSTEQQAVLAEAFGRLLLHEKTVPKRSLIEALISSPWFLKRLRETDQHESFFDGLIALVEDGSLQAKSLFDAYAQSHNVVRDLESGSLRTLYRLSLTMGETRDRHVGFVPGLENVQIWLQASTQPEQTLRALDSVMKLPEGESFALSFLNHNLLRHCNDVPSLEKVVAFSRQLSRQSQLACAIRLLTWHTTSESAQQIGLLEEVLENLESSEFRASHLGQLMKSHDLAKAFEARGLARDIASLASNVADEPGWIGCVQMLLGTDLYASTLTDLEVLRLFRKLHEADPDALLSLLAERPIVLRRLIEQGEQELVERLIRSDGLDPNASRLSDWTYHLNAAVVAQAQSDRRKPSHLVGLLASHPDHEMELRLMELVKAKEATRWVLQHDGWDPFDQAIRRLRDPIRESYLHRLFQSNDLIGEIVDLELFETLASHGSLEDFLVQRGGYHHLLESRHALSHVNPRVVMDLVHRGYEVSTEAGQRRAALRFGSIQLREIAIEAGQGPWLFDQWIKLSPTLRRIQADRERRKATLASPTSDVCFAIRVGKLDYAEKVFLDLADDDQGRLRLVRFLLNQDPPESTSLSQAMTQRLQSDPRLAFYWARAQQDHETATKIAQSLGDPALRLATVIETHRWDQLASLPVCKANELPLATLSNDIHPVHRRIEQLGYSLAARSWTPKEESRGLLDQLNEQIARDDKTFVTARYGADALLTIGEVDASLELLARRLPQRAFFWHRNRLDYAQAFRVMGLDRETPGHVFERISVGHKGLQPWRLSAVDFMLQVAVTYRDAGRKAQSEAVLAALRDHGEVLSPDARDAYLVELSRRMYRDGFPDASLQTIVGPRDFKVARTAFFAAVYRDPFYAYVAREAEVWYHEFVTRHPDDTPVRRLRRVDAVMSGAAAMDELKPFPDFRKDELATGLAFTKFRYGLHAESRFAVHRKDKLNAGDHILLARNHLAQDELRAAADSYDAAFRANPRDLTRLYLAGHYCSKSGDMERGERLKQQARQLALTVDLSIGLAMGVRSHGLQKEAIQLFECAVRALPPCHPTLALAKRLLASASQDPNESASLWQEVVLYHLRPTQRYPDIKTWLDAETRQRISRALLAIQNKDVEASREAYRAAIQVNHASQAITNRFISALNREGHSQFAKEAFQDQENYLEARVQEFPDSPVLKQRLESLRDLMGT
ncbi:MAG: hypothetical protein AAGD07_13485 [Planctomycetota bacterium]